MSIDGYLVAFLWELVTNYHNLCVDTHSVFSMAPRTYLRLRISAEPEKPDFFCPIYHMG